MEHCGRLEPRGIPQNVRSVTLPLDQVYVSFSAEQEQEWLDKRRLLEAMDDKRGSKPFATLPRYAWKELNLAAPSNIALPQVVLTQIRLVLLGKPGAGKTTITRFLAALFAHACRVWAERVTDSEGQDYGPPVLPIRIRIADYADAYRKDHALPLRRFFPDGCKCTKAPTPHLAALFESSLQSGRAFVLLDGLDEVADTPTRAAIAGCIEAFLSNLEPGNRVLITSRIAGYEEARLDSRFTPYTLLDMNRQQIEQFLRKWCVAVERFQTVEASEEDIVQRGMAQSDALLHAIDTNAGVQGLAVNPLLLTILALIHRNNTRLPEHRIELYKTATAALLRDWRIGQAAGEGREITHEEEQTLLWPLALWMHTEVETGRVAADDARRKLRELYADANGMKPQAAGVIGAVEDFLKRLTEHSGLFMPYPPDEYGFLHLTFEEYMAGQALVSDYEAAADNLRERRHKTRWEEPLRLAIAAQTAKNAANLIRRAIWCRDEQAARWGYVASPYEEILRRDLFLAARCIGDCSGIEPTLAREVAAELVDICLVQADERKYGPLVERARNTFASVRNSMVGMEAMQALLAALQDTSGTRRYEAARTLGLVGVGSAEALRALLAVLQNPGGELRGAAAIALGAVGVGSSEALHALLTALKEKDVNVQYAVADALGKVGAGSAEAVQSLLSALKETDGNVRYMAARALGMVATGSQEVMRALLAALEDENRDVRNASVHALGKLGVCSSEVLNALLAALRDSSGRIQESAVQALSIVGLGSSEALQSLLVAVDDPEVNVRYGAARALSVIGVGSKEALQALLRILQNTNASMRYVAANALGTVGVGSPEALQALLSAIKDSNGSVRAGAAQALGTVGAGSSEALQALLLALKDTDRNVRSVAATSLGKIGIESSEALPALLEASMDAEWNVRSAVLRSLGYVGTGSSRAMDVLLAALEDEDIGVRNAAWESLSKLVAE